MSGEPEAGRAETGVPNYLRCEPQYGTVVCTEHRTGYDCTNIMTHLVQPHKAPKSLRDNVQRWCNEHNVAREVTEPPHHSPPISGLQVYQGWKCNTCAELSQSLVVIEKHCSKRHGLNSKQRREAVGAVSQVSIQKWFAKSNKYWIVDPRVTARPTLEIPRTTTPPDISVSSPLVPGLSQRPACQAPAAALSSNCLSRIACQLKEEDRAQRRTIQDAEHTAEITPWLRLCRFHEHFQGIDPSLILASYLVPRTAETHAQLFYIGKSAERVLRKAHQLISSLHHIDARRLNTFQQGTLSQDPFDRLQEKRSFDKYTGTWKRLLCYFYRVRLDDYFKRPMFQSTPCQDQALKKVCEHADSIIRYVATTTGDTVGEGDDEGPSDEESKDAEWQRLQCQLDQATLQFCITLIQHRTVDAGFQSAIMSFCAAACWNPSAKTWLSENQSASVFSQVIYCCQLVTLSEAHEQSADQGIDDISETLTPLCQQWISNGQKGPIGDMLRLRLYAMRVGQDSVYADQIRWRSDGDTLMYQDLTYRVSDLAAEVSFCLEQAQLILRRDLCLGIDNIPTFRLAELEDNWDDQEPGRSFLTDVRNTGTLEEHDDWLITQLIARPDLYDLVVQHDDDDDSRVGDQVRSIFAREYEESIQLFLKYLAILLHKGSGQPGRANEFLSLRWQNKLGSKRNLYVHDGYVLFLLSYHKALQRTHASRYPVRFLLPEVGQLLVQYLVLIQPVRRLFSRAVAVPAAVSEYLWHDGEKIWSGEKFTKAGRSTSQCAIGTAVNMQSWRQISVAIAVKKFGGLDYQADLDLAGDDDDDVGGQSILESWRGPMADVFHQQAAHSVRTGNLHYGGTLNFDRGLTDAGLQEYFKASRMWHQLCRPRVLPSQAGHRRQASSTLSRSVNPPLQKRLAVRARTSRLRQRWGTEQVQFAMRQLYPDRSAVAFRSPQQAQLIDAIVSGCSEVVGVLATGQGKSLGFLLPSCLPRAAMTVVIVPLVALKADMVRRCAEAGLSYAVWDGSNETHDFMGTALLFVSVESAVRRRFRAFLGQVDAAEGLDRVVFDEAHLILTASSYRPKMALVRELRQLFCQVVFLTATLPPTMQAQFEARMLLQQPRVIRSRCFRDDIVLRLRHSRNPDLLTYAAQTVQSLLHFYRDDSAARLIVYTVTRHEADRLSEQVGCPRYYSDSGDVSEKQQAMDQWRRGLSKVMVATSAFGMGIDFPSVRQVIHVGVPTDMIGFAQEIGRLSRDGQGGHSRVILPAHWHGQGLPSLVDQRRTAVSALAMSVYLYDNRCLSAVISRFLDGPEGMQYCTADEPRSRCSKCEQFGLFRVGEEEDGTAYWDPGSGSGQVDSSEEEAEYATATGLGTSGPTAERSGGREHGADDVMAGRLQEGGQRLRDSMREVAIGRERYEGRLRTIRGRCMVCLMLGRGHIPVEHQWHDLRHCGHVEKRTFFVMKKRAIERNEGRGGWIKAYAGCFQCGQPQEICRVEEGPGRGGCEYRDMIFPAAWGLWRRDERWGRTMGELSGAASAVWESEDKWMDWLGNECELYGMRACQAARMMDVIMGLEMAEIQ